MNNEFRLIILIFYSSFIIHSSSLAVMSKQSGNVIGRVSKITEQRVNGWAFFKHKDTKPMLRLVVNGFDEYYFFIHIPKTAGSSFRQMLYKQFGQELIYPNLNDIKQNGGYYPTHQTIKEATQSKDRPFQFLMGHYPYSTGKLLARPPRHLVFLRDPIKRAISHLYHFKRQGIRQVKKNSLHEIIDEAGWQFNNLQVRYMSGKNFQANKVYLENTELGENALQQAKKNIDKCDFVGLTEDFDNSIELLERIFDWQLGKTLKKNVAPKRHRKIPDDLYQEIKALNQLDMALYEYAQVKYADLRRTYSVFS